jgi:hypothetical protein
LFIEHCKAWHRNPDPTLELFNQKLRGNLLKIFMAKFLMFSQDDDSNLQRENSELIDKMKDINKMLEEMLSNEKMNPEAWLLFLKQQESRIQIADEGKDKTMKGILSKLKSLDSQMKLLKNNNIATKGELLNKCKLSAIERLGKNKLTADLKAQIKNLKNNLEKTQNSSDEATRNSADLKAHNNILTKDLNNARADDITNLKKTKCISDEVTRKLETTMKNTSVKDTEIDDLNAQINIITNDLNNARTDFKNLKTNLEQLEKKKNIYQEANIKLEAKYQLVVAEDSEMLKKAKISIDEKSVKIESLLQQMAIKEKNQNEILTKLEQLEKKNNIYQEANKNIEAKYQLVIGEDSEKLRQAKISIDEKSVKTESLLQQMAIKEKNQNEILTKLEQLKKKNNIHQQVIAENSNLLCKAKNVIDEKSVIIESLLQQMAIKEKTITETNVKLVAAQNELKTAIKNTRVRDSQIIGFKSRNNSLTNYLNNAKAKLQEKTQNDILTTLKQDLDETTERLVTAQNNSEEKHSENVSFKIKMEKLQHSENDLKVDTKVKEAEIFQLKANINKLTIDLHIAKTIVVFEENRDCKCDVKGAIIETVKKEVEKLKKTLKLRDAGCDLQKKEISIRNDEIKLLRLEIEQLKE